MARATQLGSARTSVAPMQDPAQEDSASAAPVSRLKGRGKYKKRRKKIALDSHKISPLSFCDSPIVTTTKKHLRYFHFQYFLPQASLWQTLKGCIFCSDVSPQ